MSMKTYTPAELQQILADHKAYLNGTGGSRADLRSANLSGADLRSADLSGADLSGADLRSANLYGANLSGADLSGADLRSANLYGANLYGANLSGADLSGANLSGADLRSANLYGADLYGAKNWREARGLLQIVPEVGAFDAFKKIYGHGGSYIAHLRIPATALRLGGFTERKCRASEAEVISITRRDGTQPPEGEEFFSAHDTAFKYVVGAVVTPHEFNPDPTQVCAGGIHFFLTRQEAVEY